MNEEKRLMEIAQIFQDTNKRCGVETDILVMPTQADLQRIYNLALGDTEEIERIRTEFENEWQGADLI